MLLSILSTYRNNLCMILLFWIFYIHFLCKIKAHIAGSSAVKLDISVVDLSFKANKYTDKIADSYDVNG